MHLLHERGILILHVLLNLLGLLRLNLRRLGHGQKRMFLNLLKLSLLGLRLNWLNLSRLGLKRKVKRDLNGGGE
jgi:hypothetical protein